VKQGHLQLRSGRAVNRDFVQDIAGQKGWFTDEVLEDVLPRRQPGVSDVARLPRLGVAAITYDPLARSDLSKYPLRKPTKLWKELEPSQKASLRRVAYEMAPGDVIYVKQGPRIVDKGIVTGRYKFDSQFRLVDPSGGSWAHQVPVDWSREFTPIKLLLGAEQLTVKELSAAVVEQIKREEKKSLLLARIELKII
jgi:hypothetical protein